MIIFRIGQVRFHKWVRELNSQTSHHPLFSFFPLVNPATIIGQKMDFSIMFLFIYFNIAVALKIPSIKQKLILGTIATIKDSSAWIIQKKQKCDIHVFYLHVVFSTPFHFFVVM